MEHHALVCAKNAQLGATMWTRHGESGPGMVAQTGVIITTARTVCRSGRKRQATVALAYKIMPLPTSCIAYGVFPNRHRSTLHVLWSTLGVPKQTQLVEHGTALTLRSKKLHQRTRTRTIDQKPKSQPGLQRGKSLPQGIGRATPQLAFGKTILADIASGNAAGPKQNSAGDNGIAW